jgi:hypothetical protein
MNDQKGAEMTTELNPSEKEEKKVNVKYQSGSDTIYSMGLVGAWVYYIGRATTNRERVKGFFKAFIWPGILVYELLKFFEKE